MIRCAECGGELFHLVQLPDGSTRLQCYNYGEHEREIDDEERRAKQ